MNNLRTSFKKCTEKFIRQWRKYCSIVDACTNIERYQRKTFVRVFDGLLDKAQIFPLILAAKEPIVQINSGKVQGSFAKSYYGRTYMQFYGIPYAKPPIGELRFEAPQEAQPWKGIWYANLTTSCIQVNHEDEPEGGKTEGSEDCLHLNVFIPGTEIIESSSLDVIVHIHGGGFMFGSSTSYAGPKYFMDRDVIIVTMNYRVGIFGFLSALDENLPGNFGMKDQVLALRWIKDNIASFGGNPNSITITGLSAGGASVHYHMLSPLSKGLFTKAISVSGCALNPWTLQENPVEKTKRIAQAVGCGFDSSNAQIKNCLKQRNAEQIVEATRLLRIWTYVPFSPLGLVVDAADHQPFLPEHPYKLMVDGNVNDVPWIVSATTAEGLYPVAQLAMKDKYFEELRDNWDEYLAAILDYQYTVPHSSTSEIGAKIKEHYLGPKDVSKDSFPEIIQLASDRLFVYGLEQSARLMAKAIKSPVYFYQYNYTADNMPSLTNFLCHYPEKYGVSHADDTFMIFDINYTGPLSDADLQMTKFLLDVWTTFAKSGVMDNLLEKSWMRVNGNDDEIGYLYIGNPNEIEMRNTKELGKRQFWESLPFAENENLKLKQFIKTEL